MNLCWIEYLSEINLSQLNIAKFYPSFFSWFFCWLDVMGNPKSVAFRVEKFMLLKDIWKFDWRSDGKLKSFAHSLSSLFASDRTVNLPRSFNFRVSILLFYVELSIINLSSEIFPFFSILSLISPKIMFFFRLGFTF